MAKHWLACACVSLGALSMTSAAFAAGATHVLREALGALPAEILLNPDPIQAEFIDVRALFGLSEQVNSEAGVLRRATLAQGLRPMQTLQRSGADAAALAAWEAAGGVGLDDVRYFAGFGQPPVVLTLWGLTDSATVGQVMDGLSARGFAPVAEHTAMWANGASMEVDFAQREPGNPWRGDLGQSSFVGPAGDALVHASGPAPVAFVMGAGGGAADNVIIATALAGLDMAVGDHALVQAMVFSPAIGLSAGPDMSGLITPNVTPAQVQEAYAAAIAAAGEGVPPYFGGIVADVQFGERPGVSVALSYGDCAMAEQAASVAETRWHASLAHAGAVETEAMAVAFGDAGCAAVLNVIGEPGGAEVNRLLNALMGQIMQRQPGVLSIGLGA